MVFQDSGLYLARNCFSNGRSKRHVSFVVPSLEDVHALLSTRDNPHKRSDNRDFVFRIVDKDLFSYFYSFLTRVGGGSEGLGG